ncbi:aldo/keto reductase [Collimonas pratensis]|uniref:Aldo/keto reductase family protein n=1 Tax=Collimonas pratensis TaxID=279113 RepID=A0ABM5Z3T1_9BURK|nr:aldo/keto reductase [Collimonas pratensis]AMP13727.1 aldo/keto reductase family protein [Collimonas pratensis]
MQTVRFGRTGLKVSRFCLGTMSMGSSKWKGWVLDEDKTAPILKSALDLGINFFDMADWYSNGANEEVVGRTLLKLKQRDSLVLATKAFYAMSEDANDQGSSRKHLMASIDRSLRRIGTDYIDLYLLHAFDPHTPLAETMEALHDIVKSGKARYIGACTMYAWQFAEMNAIARQNNWTEFVNMQCQYSLLYREEEREMMPYCQDQGIAVSTFSPLARGYLTGVQKSARTQHDPFLSQFFGDEIDVEIASRVVKIAADKGVQPGQIAMAWVAQNGNSTVPIIGADSVEQLQLAVQAGEIVLSAEECQYLEQPYRPRDMINDYNEVRRPRSYKA